MYWSFLWFSLQKRIITQSNFSFPSWWEEKEQLQNKSMKASSTTSKSCQTIMCLNALQIFQSLKLVRLAKNAIAISTNCLFAKEERRKNVRELHNPGEIVLKRLHRTQEMGLLLPLRPLSFWGQKDRH